VQFDVCVCVFLCHLVALYVSRLSDGLPAHFYAGLLSAGDEVMRVNNVAAAALSLDTVLDVIAQSASLILELRPAAPVTLM